MDALFICLDSSVFLRNTDDYGEDEVTIKHRPRTRKALAVDLSMAVKPPVDDPASATGPQAEVARTFVYVARMPSGRAVWEERKPAREDRTTTNRANDGWNTVREVDDAMREAIGRMEAEYLGATLTNPSWANYRGVGRLADIQPGTTRSSPSAVDFDMAVLSDEEL